MNKYYRLLNISRYAIAIVLLGLGQQTWGRKPYLKAGHTITIPSIGLKMKMPKYAKPNPAKSLTVKTLVQRRGTETRKIDVCLLEELWLRDQLSGSYGNTSFMVSVYEMRLPAPTAVKTVFKQPGHTFVFKSVYEQWLNTQKPVKWNKEKMRSWLKQLLPDGANANIKLTKKNFSRTAITYYAESGSLDVENLVYIVASQTAPIRHLAIQFKLEPQLDRKKSLRTIKSCLSSIRFFPPTGLKKDEKKRIISRKKLTAKKDWSPQYIASRERVINNIKNLKDWWYLETNNFIVVANIDNRKTVKELKAGLEKSRTVFMQIYPIKEPLKAVSVVKAFETRKEYIAYIGKQYEWTGGLWIADKKELVVSPMNFGSARARRKMLVDVIQHEGFHQYIYFATGEQHTAVWFNEGNATFFEGIEFKGKNAVIETTYRTGKVTNLVSSANIEKLLTMNHNEFYGINKTQNYILAYGLMFFLQKGALGMKGKYKNSYSEIPLKYYQAILKTRDATQATKIAWQGVDMKKFNQAFNKFWSSKSLIKRAVRYDLVK
jgi:hypothetical protein